MYEYCIDNIHNIKYFYLDINDYNVNKLEDKHKSVLNVNEYANVIRIDNDIFKIKKYVVIIYIS